MVEVVDLVEDLSLTISRAILPTVNLLKVITGLEPRILKEEMLDSNLISFRLQKKVNLEPCSIQSVSQVLVESSAQLVQLDNTSMTTRLENVYNARTNPRMHITSTQEK